MEKQKFEQYLTDRYENQLKWYDNQSLQNKRWYQRLQWPTIVLSALVPALVVAHSDRLKWITAILAIGLAIATTGLKTFKYQENWVNYRTIAEALKKEKHYYDAGALEYASAEDKEQLFVERVEVLIATESTSWMAIQTKKESKEKTKAG